jgi:CheY-like chemotaxis protein
VETHPVRPIELLLVQSEPAEVLVVKESLIAAKIINNLRIVDSGERAMDYLQRRGAYAGARRPDLLLLNWHLPQMSGLKVLTAVRADAELASLPVAVLGGSEEPQQLVQAQARALGANWFVMKPIDAGTLLDIVRASAELWLCIVSVPEVPVLLRRPRARG